MVTKEVGHQNLLTLSMLTQIFYFYFYLFLFYFLLVIFTVIG